MFNHWRGIRSQGNSSLMIYTSGLKQRVENNSIDSETLVKLDSFSFTEVFLKVGILFLMTLSLNQEVYNKREGSLTPELT